MKIIELRAENIKKIRAVHIRPDGNLVQISGPNGSGKTSVLDSIKWALDGAKDIQFQPIRKGQESARVRLDLGEVIVTRRFGRGGSTSLTVENGAGAIYRSPQKMLDDLIGDLSFDPLAFSRMASAQQFETLRKLVPLTVDIDALDLANQQDYEQRRMLNREISNLKSQADNFGAIRADLPEQVIETEGLITALSEASQRNADVETNRRRHADAQERDSVQVGQLRRDALTNRKKAGDLRRQADLLESEAEILEHRAARMEESLAQAAPDFGTPVDVQQIRQQIDDAHLINGAIAGRDLFRRLQESRQQKEAEAEALTAQIDERSKRKMEAIAQARMPVEGLGFGEGIVLLNDLPFDQASQAEQLRVSCAIAMAANPKLRVLRIKDGSLLDESGLALLAGMAAQQDYQIWLERVDTSGNVGVVLEDGHIAGIPEEDPGTYQGHKIKA